MGPNEEGRRDARTGTGTRSCPAPQASPGAERPEPGRRRPGPPTPGGGATGHRADAPVAAALHAEQIAQGFLSVLGPGFLGASTGGSAVGRTRSCCGRERRAGRSGFVAGSTDVGGLYRTLPLARRDPGRRRRPPGRCWSGWRRVLETLRPRLGRRGRVGTGHRAAGHRRRPGVARDAVSAAAGGRLPRRGAAPAAATPPTSWWARTTRARSSPLRAGRIRDRRALRAPRRHRSLLMQWDRRPGGAGPDDAGPS